MRFLAILPVLFGLPALATLVDTQFPHMLLPLNKSQPNTAFPTQADAIVSYNSTSGDERWTAVNFDVPDIKAANICRLRFVINKSPAKNAPFSLKGVAPFAINISRIDPKLVNGGTTWNNKPAVIEHYDTYVLSTSGAGEIVSKWFTCPKGNVAQFYIHPAGTRDLEVYWYELNYGANDGGPHGIVLEMHS